MGNFNKRRDGGRNFGGNRGDRGGRGFDKSRGGMHKAVCDECGKNCEVPFRPTGGKPIYCNDCFSKKKDGVNSRDRGNKSRFDKNKSAQRGGETPNYKAQFEMLNAKLDKILKALNPDVSEELFGEVEEVIETPKAKAIKEVVKKEKAPKKEVDTKALKKALAESKKAPANKVVAKKPAVKKSTVKKTVAKKTTTKKSTTKKTK